MRQHDLLKMLLLLDTQNIVLRRRLHQYKVDDHLVHSVPGMCRMYYRLSNRCYLLGLRPLHHQKQNTQPLCFLSRQMLQFLQYHLLLCSIYQQDMPCIHHLLLVYNIQHCTQSYNRLAHRGLLRLMCLLLHSLSHNWLDYSCCLHLLYVVLCTNFLSVSCT